MDCSDNRIVMDLGGNIIKMQNSFIKVERNWKPKNKNRDSKKKEIKKNLFSLNPPLVHQS